jgi:hypothetical protein
MFTNLYSDGRTEQGAADPTEHLGPFWVRRVGFVMLAVGPVYPRQQTFPDTVRTSHLCHKRLSGGVVHPLPTARCVRVEMADFLLKANWLAA